MSDGQYYWFDGPGDIIESLAQKRLVEVVERKRIEVSDSRGFKWKLI